MLDDLAGEQAVVVGTLVEGAEQEQVCEAENLESLLRMARADATPAFQALPVDQLPLFLAVFQGLHEPGDTPEALRRRLEPLLGCDAPAGLWETEILPARMRGYQTPLLDGVLQESGLRWVGCGHERLTFCFEHDLDLLAGPTDEEAEPDGSGNGAASLFPNPHGRYDFSTLQELAGLDAPALAAALWDGAWSGRIGNDSFAAVRRGLDTGFRPPEAPAAEGLPPGGGLRGPRPRGGRLSRRAAGRWRGTTVYPGSWQLLPRPEAAADPLEEEERNKDRVRLLLDRYGVLFRELLQRELPALRWKGLFRALRLMELSGEILAGHFFEGVPGPQFASHRAFRLSPGTCRGRPCSGSPPPIRPPPAASGSRACAPPCRGGWRAPTSSTTGRGWCWSRTATAGAWSSTSPPTTRACPSTWRPSTTSSPAPASRCASWRSRRSTAPRRRPVPSPTSWAPSSICGATTTA